MEYRKLKTLFYLIAGLVTAAPAAFAADDIAKTFSAEAKGNSVNIYSTSDKERFCTVSVKFSILQDGKRIDGRSGCQDATIPAGKHVFVCDFTRPIVIKPKIEGPVEGSCKD